jgi:drug/metabolite transporter (DMT)-like permease
MNSSDTPPSAAATNKLAGRLWMVVAALMWSSSGLFAKAPIFDDWSDSDRGPLLAFWRALFAAAVLVPMIRRPRWQRDLVPLTICFAGMNVTYLTAMSLTTAANAIWLQSTAPWWVFVMGLVLLSEPVVRRDLIPLCFAVLGVGTILLFEIQGQAKTGVAFGVGAGISYAGVVVFMGRLSAENSSWLVALNHAVAALVLLPWVLLLGHWPSPLQLLVLVGFGVFQMAVPYLFLIRALRSISSQEAVAIGLLEPVLMPLWVLLVWGEQPAWWTIVGAALILTGLLLRYLFLEGLWPGGNRAA